MIDEMLQEGVAVHAAQSTQGRDRSSFQRPNVSGHGSDVLFFT